ncbi:MAG TPA: amylo-alpha-1,6-glucosidase [Burkholderiales bacterium]|nr:amylo-alpha-1,6-glucosidase [Burkholderiales bacterium]
MKQEAVGTVFIPGVVSLAASSRRTLKHGDSFAMFDEFGDVLEVQHSPQGVFHHDTRFLSRLHFMLEGRRPLMLSSTVQPDNVTLDVDLTNPDIFADGELRLAKDTFHVARAKFLWQAGCYELFIVTSYAEQPTRVRLALEFDADFADLFEIRGYQRGRRGAVRAEVRGPAEVRFVYDALDGIPRSTRICFSLQPARLSSESAEFVLDLGARTRTALGMTVLCEEGEAARRKHGGSAQQEVLPYFSALRRARRSAAAARAAVPSIETSNTVFSSVLSRSSADLAMLMSETPHGPYPYAGVPWFSTAFGRDGLITALEMLWFDPAIARGVLRFLAAHQARAEDPAADMEPGKILHEVRECELARLGEVPFGRYYGSVDATPLFVALAGQYWQRTRDRATVEALWPAVRAALNWMARSGDRNHDGFLDYGRRSERGLRNQGWKDSEDAVFHADGRLAEGRIALCEVQGYAYLAYREAALLAFDLGEKDLSKDLETEAERLQKRFEAAFWCDDLGTYALALDGAGEPCQVRTSNAGQVLFSGIAKRERAARVVQDLFGADFFTGWGIRTLGAREKRFNPISYHNGSVWPHDNGLIALGLARYGHSAEARSLTAALFDAAAHMHLRRLPELFCGFERRRGKAPTLYPVACAPQAWAACAPFALLQACLGLEVDAASETVRLRQPRLPSSLESLVVRRLHVGESRLDLLLRRQESSVAVTLLSREGAAEVEVVL